MSKNPHFLKFILCLFNDKRISNNHKHMAYTWIAFNRRALLLKYFTQVCMKIAKIFPQSSKNSGRMAGPLDHIPMPKM